MATVTFSNGKTATFNGTPTPEDIDYVAKQMGIQPDQAPKAPEAKPNPISEVAKGFGKGVLNTVRQVGGVDTNPFVKGMLDNAPKLKEGADIEKGMLEPTTPMQSLGKGAESIAEMAIPVATGAKVATGGVRIAKNLLKGSEDAIYDAIAPKLTSTETSKEAVRLGTQAKGLLNQVSLNKDKFVQKMVDKVIELVPDFEHATTFSQKANMVKKVVAQKAGELEARILQSGKDSIYSMKELGSAIAKIPEPISLKGTAFEKQVAPLKKAVLQIAQEEGGKVSRLLSVRQKFDDLVEKTWPSIWDKESAPMRNVVFGIRDAITDFTTQKLPKGFGLDEALKEQHLLLKAYENLAEKAGGEVGTNAVTRFTQNHPMVSGVLKALPGAGETSGLLHLMGGL